MLQLTYDIHTYTAKARLSFCTHMNRCDAVNRSIFRIFRPIYMQRNHTQSSNSALFTRWAHIQHIHIYCEGTIQLLRTYTLMQRSKSIDLLIFWSTYMRRKYIHCEDTTQSLLIYTERQQRLCAYAATNIRHSHTYCEGTTQLLHTYTSVQRNKSIDFNFLINLHMSTTATSLRMRCNSYTSYTYTLRRHDSAFAHLHACMMQ